MTGDPVSSNCLIVSARALLIDVQFAGPDIPFRESLQAFY